MVSDAGQEAGDLQRSGATLLHRHSRYGGLEFHPSTGPDHSKSELLDVDKLVELASEILTHRATLSTHFANREGKGAVQEILRVGTSAGGARAKALIAWNRDTNEIRSGQMKPDNRFEQWIIKFDGVSNNRDRELADPTGYGLIEYAYSKMARDAGISMTECRLFEESGRKHFMTKRFDRTENGDKIHMQSLAALGHYDFNLAGAHSYEQAIMIMRELNLDSDSIRQLYRRMVFNIVARNQDDHVKNIAFLMNRKGTWSLSPAFDVTYAYNPTGTWTGRHQMTLNGKRDEFTLDDFEACGRLARAEAG